jgi:hypothetical protein
LGAKDQPNTDANRIYLPVNTARGDFAMKRLGKLLLNAGIAAYLGLSGTGAFAQQCYDNPTSYRHFDERFLAVPVGGKMFYYDRVTRFVYHDGAKIAWLNEAGKLMSVDATGAVGGPFGGGAGGASGVIGGGAVAGGGGAAGGIGGVGGAIGGGAGGQVIAAGGGAGGIAGGVGGAGGAAGGAGAAGAGGAAGGVAAAGGAGAGGAGAIGASGFGGNAANGAGASTSSANASRASGSNATAAPAAANPGSVVNSSSAAKSEARPAPVAVAKSDKASAKEAKETTETADKPFSPSAFAAPSEVNTQFLGVWRNVTKDLLGQSTVFEMDLQADGKVTVVQQTQGQEPTEFKRTFSVVDGVMTLSDGISQQVLGRFISADKEKLVLQQADGTRTFVRASTSGPDASSVARSN